MICTGLRNQFSEEQLLQLAGQIAFENYRARFNRVFDVESDNLYQGTTAR
jgi:alkylhydroperoxidase family enzyme